MTSFVSDDPYYCGLRARVPNFVNGKQLQQPQQGQPMNEGGKPNSKSSNSKKGHGNQSTLSPPPPSRSTPNLQNLAQLPGAAPPFWWHSRLYPDSHLTFSVRLLCTPLTRPKLDKLEKCQTTSRLQQLFYLPRFFS